MPPSTDKNIIASGRLPSKKKPVLLVLTGIVVVLFIVVCWYGWTIYNSKQQKTAKIQAESSQIAQEILKKQEATRKAIYAAPAYDASAEQQFSSLRGKAITAQYAGEWQLAVDYTNQSLAIQGYQSDLGSLIRLADAYKQLGQTDSRVEALKRAKAAYEAIKATDNDDYRAVVKELG